MKSSTMEWAKRVLLVSVAVVLPFGIPIAIAYGVYSWRGKKDKECTQSSMQTESSKSSMTEET